MSFVAVSAANIVTPGPANLNTLRRAMQLGVWPVVPTILGNALGLAVGGLICAAGVAGFVVASPVAWTVFRWLGVGYLAWLGGKMIIRRDLMPTPAEASGAVPARTLFVEAFGLAVTNPKALLFYVALFPQVLTAHAPLWQQSAVLIATYCGLSILSLSAYATLADILRRRVMTQRRYDVFRMASGAVLVGFALSMTL